MGRARATTAVGFTAVFGTRRGSDFRPPEEIAAEEAAAAAAVREFALSKWRRDIASSSLSEVRRDLANALIDGYGEEGEFSATERLAREFGGWHTPVSEIAVLLALGDPRDLPGLTAPLEVVLAQHFERQVDNEFYHDLFDDCSEVLESCFINASRGAQLSAEYYLRLQPLSRSIEKALESPHLAQATSPRLHPLLVRCIDIAQRADPEAEAISGWQLALKRLAA